MSNMSVPKFFWWIGIVEDRADPEFLGRYRVRILGYHTGNKAILPTNELPWAVPVMPVTSASISGVGQSSALVEGSSVIGFFADGEDGQQPIIFGSFTSLPQVGPTLLDEESNEKWKEYRQEALAELQRQLASVETALAEDINDLQRDALEEKRDLLKKQIEDLSSTTGIALDYQGFVDPRGIFPRDGKGTGFNYLKEPDSSRLARGADAEHHFVNINKRDTRLIDIPRATAPIVSSIFEKLPNTRYDRGTWQEPAHRFSDMGPSEDGLGYVENNEVTTEWEGYVPIGTKPESDLIQDGKTSMYPFNKVWETETGHCFEVDDTPGNGRISNYHNSGTFEEIQADGTKITKVVGDGYDITLKDKRVEIRGSCDIHVAGDASLYVQGDMYTEVDGNQFNSIKGNRVTKVGGNDLLEVLSSQNTQINGQRGCRVTGDDTETIVGNQTHSVGQDKRTTVSGKVSEKHLSDMKVTVGSNYTTLVGGDYNLGVAGLYSMGAGKTSTIKSKQTMTLETKANQIVKVATDIKETAKSIDSTVTNTWKLKGANVDIDGSSRVDIN